MMSGVSDGAWSASRTAGEQRVNGSATDNIGNVRERQKLVLEAIADVFSQQHRILDALSALGHRDAYTVAPSDLAEQIALFAGGSVATIGTQEAPYVIRSGDGRIIARYYVEVEDERCRFRMSGSAEFIETVEQLAKDAGNITVH
jgi:hypothetical protein